jgi:hypothetical protein
VTEVVTEVLEPAMMDAEAVGLAKVPAFGELLAELERKKERLRKEFADTVLLGDEVDQREADRRRGMMEGLDYPAAIVRGMEAALEKLDREAEQSEPDDNEEMNLWPKNPQQEP